ncbi:MAG: T9SS type A sorting domain-containing protein [Bacteroidetes bacterium]|nr:T9SS type A sorting domain-containing protein [Bacteroidota bacterium]
MKRTFIFAILLTFACSAQGFWIQTQLPATGSINSIAISPGGTLFVGTEFAAAGSGVFKSTNDGLTWSLANTGLTSSTIKVVAMGGSNGDLFAGSSSLFRSTNQGASWTDIGNSLSTPYVRAIDFDDSNYIYVGTEGGGVFRSTNNGSSFTFSGLSVFNVKTLHCDNFGFIYAGGGNLYRSSNRGATWFVFNTGMQGTTVEEIVSNNIGYIYAGTYGNGVYRSTNSGLLWVPVNNGLTNLNVVSLAINAVGHLYAGTYDGGVFRSKDQGENWTEVSSGLNTTGIPALAFNPSGNIFAGSTDGKVFKSTGSTTSLKDDEGQPSGFTLSQNYPNPFNPVTVIEYTLTETAEVVLKVFAVDGTKVATLREGVKTPGKHRILFDGSTLSSGVYSYALFAGKERMVRKLVLAK